MQYDLSAFGMIRISGEKAFEFLQGQLTCDVSAIKKAKYGGISAHCNPQGRMISLFYIAFHANHFYLTMPTDLISLAIKALKKYAIFFKVDIADVSNEWTISGQYQPPSNSNDQIAFHAAPHSKRYLQARKSDKANPSTSSADLNSWIGENIKELIPQIYAATSGKLLPHEVRLTNLNAVSFNKGCYTGQEIIARIHYRGKVKSQFCKAIIQTNTAPKPGDSIYTTTNDEPNECGMIVEASRANDNLYQSLIAINRPENNLFLKDQLTQVSLVTESSNDN